MVIQILVDTLQAEINCLNPCVLLQVFDICSIFEKNAERFEIVLCNMFAIFFVGIRKCLGDVIYDCFHGLCFQLRCGVLKYDTDGVSTTLKSSDSSGFNSLFR